MTQEEKAKAYDEALKKAREFYNEAKVSEFFTIMSDYEEIFPELVESKDLEEEIQGMYQAIFGTDIINRREMVYLETFDMLARHFAEWGAKHKDSLQVQETCQENQDSFTDKPKEMSVDGAMKYIDEKIAKTRASKSWEGVDVDKFLDEIRGRETDDLEKAADNHIRKKVDAAGHPGWDWTTRDIEDAFIAGAKWMESQMPMPEDTVIFMKGVEEGRRLEREDRNDDKLPRLTKDYYYGG